MDQKTPQPFDYEAAAQSLLDLIAQFVHTNLNRALYSMMHGEGFALLLLREADKLLLPSELSAELNVSTARITALLNALESKQMILRQPDPDDRRKTRICLTAAGRSQADLIFNEIRCNAVYALSHLSEQDASDFLRILRRILAIAEDIPYPFPGGKS